MQNLNQITRFVIHPAVGISRVGNSEKGWFYAPEVPDQPADPRVPQYSDEISYKDEEGGIKRQAARFRVYGLDKDGKVVAEINDALNTKDLQVEVEWSVHLANRKAAWYQYINPLDLNLLSEQNKTTNKIAVSPIHRNNSFGGVPYLRAPDRASLVIDAGIQKIKGNRQNSGPLNKGKFMGVPVYLGELKTDDKGRLIVLGGKGLADTITPFNPVHHFANNDGWYDDISDGPVRATITIKKKDGTTSSHTAEPSMVAVVPPNYGQGLYGTVTMLDIVRDVYYNKKKGGIARPKIPSFKEHIWPIFKSLSDAQWVNQGIYVLFGQGSPHNFTDKEVFKKLCSKSERHSAFKKEVFSWFRNPLTKVDVPTQIPPNYGDALRDFFGQPNENLWVTPTQYHWLKQWSEGEFIEDMKRLPKPELPLPDKPMEDPLKGIPLNEQPDILNKAALQECLGGPFRPGIEVSWPFRVDQMWKEAPRDGSAPFRLNIVDKDEEVKDDYGPVLSPDVAMAPNGPVHFSGPGTLTRWMGVPWQADAASCLGGLDESNYLPTPTLWATRAPQNVINELSVSRIEDKNSTDFQREKHFNLRQFWLRDLNNTDVLARLNTMASEWYELGIIAAKKIDNKGLRDDVPDVIWVEQFRASKFSGWDPTYLQVLVAEGKITPEQAKKILEVELKKHRDLVKHPEKRSISRRIYGRLER